MNFKIENKSIFISGFASKNNNFASHFFQGNGKTKSWDYIKSEWNLESKLRYFWIQLTDALPKLWKESILSSIGNSINLCIFDCHLIEKNNLYCLNKLGSRELYQIQVSEKYKKRTLQLHYEGYFNNFDFDWKLIYLLPHMVTADTTFLVFQHKILKNIFFVNKMLSKLRKVESPLCSFKDEDESYIHLFYRCWKISILWRRLEEFFTKIRDLKANL